MNRIITLLVLFFLGPVAHAADVLYACNVERDYIQVTEESYTKFNPPFGKTETVSASTLTEITDQDQAAVRKGTKPLVKRCKLSSGEYLVTFDAQWINARLDGLDGADDWVTVEIKNEKGNVFSRTAMGRCDSSRYATRDCKDKWAVEIWFSARNGKTKFTRLIDEWAP